MSAALPRARLSTCRGSAIAGEPSGMEMSQNMRAVLACVRQGSSWKVDGSGCAIMSDS